MHTSRFPAILASALIVSSCLTDSGPTSPASAPEDTPAFQAVAALQSSERVEESFTFVAVFETRGRPQLAEEVFVSGEHVSLRFEQSFDAGTSTLHLDISLLNEGPHTLSSPIRGGVTGVHPRAAQVEGDAEIETSEVAAVDFGQALGVSGRLRPGEWSQSRRMSIEMPGNGSVAAFQNLRLHMVVIGTVEAAGPEVPRGPWAHIQPWPQEWEFTWCHDGEGTETFDMQYRKPGEEWEVFTTRRAFYLGPRCPSHVLDQVHVRGGQTLDFRLRACDGERCSAYTEPLTVEFPPLALVELKWTEGGVINPDRYWDEPESEGEGYKSWLVDRYLVIYPQAVADDGWEIASHSGPWPGSLSEDRTTVRWAAGMEDEGPYVFEVVFVKKDS